MDTVNEGSTAWLTASFLDKVGAPVTPSEVKYNIVCETTGATIKPDTTIAANQTVEIEITAAENAMQVAENSMEVRVVTIKATYSGGFKKNSRFRYELVNLRGV